MSRDHILRPVLRVAALFNVVGAYLFAFPASTPGHLAGLPANAPVVYRAMTALFILLFAGAYAWLASQPTINRPFVGFAAIGKAAAFMTVFALWAGGAVPATSVLAITGDLVLALIFAWCLLRSPA